jgi:hypothetical protein
MKSFADMRVWPRLQTRFALRATGALFVAAALASALPVRVLPAQEPASGERIDGQTGAVWALVRDRAHPADLPRWLLVEAGNTMDDAARPVRREPPVIHAGDRIVVEEHTAVADARFEAMALTSAPKGDRLRARIAIGGRIVLAQAIGAGEAEAINGNAEARQ